MAAAVALDGAAIASELFPNQPEGFPYEVYDIMSVQLPEGDDVGIPSEDEDDEEDVEVESGFGSVIVVANLPVVPEEKFEKLAGVVKKIFSAVGTIREGGFFMPQDESKGTKGFAFVEFTTPQEAVAAREQVDGYKLDKNHVLKVNMFDDLDKYARVPDVYAAPEAKPYEPQGQLHAWLTDKLARDQFATRQDNNVSVLWNDAKRARSETAFSRTNWTESFFQFSPLGTYITTVHRQGVAVWGCDVPACNVEWKRLMRYPHPGVRLLEFSPNERYLITYSAQEPTNPRDSATVCFMVFDVRGGKKLRMFEGTLDDYAVGAGAVQGGPIRWPAYKWAGGREDKYFARLGKNMLSVYQCPDMGLLDKKSIKMDGVQDFEWSPSEPVLAAYTTEQGNMPARIVLVKIPERTEIRQKNLFSVSDIKIFWHPQGDYLAVKVDRYTKTKKSTYTGFELFSIRDKDIPMQVLELPNKSEKIHTFAWEPKGHRFAVVHGDGPRPSVSFYTMRDEKGRLAVKLLGTVANKACTHVIWSPQGKHIVLAGLKGFNGQMEFFSVDELETMATAEHFMATDVEWDPTGRYVATSVTASQVDNGFHMWNFQGKSIYMERRDRMVQFQWRPRPASLLPAEREAEVVKNLKAYTKRYDEEDEALLQAADADVLEERKRFQDEWSSYQASRREYAALVDEFKRKMYGDRYAEREYTLEKVTVEQVVDLREELYTPK